jgi:hypothetical protein
MIYCSFTPSLKGKGRSDKTVLMVPLFPCCLREEAGRRVKILREGYG